MAQQTAVAHERLVRGSGMTSPRARGRLIDRLQQAGIKNPNVLDTLREVPRHLFVEEALASRAYEDTALPIGNSQTISQPYIVARMTEALLEGAHCSKVLEIGTGSGYQTAVLAHLVQQVYSVERIERLSRLAHARLEALDLCNVVLSHRDGFKGLMEAAPYDGIMVTAAPEGVPLELVRQLRIGGCMVIPVGTRELQGLVRIIRTAEGYEKEVLEQVAFVPLLDGIC